MFRLSVVDAEFAKDPTTREDPQAKKLLEDMQQAVRQAKELGVKIADGSDAARPNCTGEMRTNWLR